ncbi:MAG: single-stranded DNA-binding protein, partial [Oscillospiraceae bacterium]
MLNIVALQGRLTADPELRQTQSGISVARFTLAVDRSFAKAGEERKADFINCLAWRQTADFVCKYFHKGSAMV